MVSFHCDACTDIVKKPKLDRHYAQCRFAFTCIDCNTTFKAPAEWKGHTSCVTEAEKYQKSLYPGPKKGSRPDNGRQTNPTPKMMNAPGKYHQSSSTQSSWSHHQYIRNRASGANNTPLGSPRRMSPVDSPAVVPSLSSAKAASTIEGGEHKKQDSGAVSHTPNGAESKEKKRKRKRDPPREHDVKDEQPANADGSSKRHRGSEKSGDDSQPKTQPSIEDIPQNSGDKKVKKKKKEKREEAQPKQGDTNEENAAPLKPVAPPANDKSKAEKKSKKRKHEEKVEEGAAAEPEALPSGAEKKVKKTKDKDVKSGVNAVGGEQEEREDGEKKRKKKRSEVGQS